MKKVISTNFIAFFRSRERISGSWQNAMFSFPARRSGQGGQTILDNSPSTVAPSRADRANTPISLTTFEKRYKITVWITIVCSAEFANAQSTPSPKPIKAPALGGACAFAMAEGRLVQTDCSVQTVYRGVTYCFASIDSRAKFISDADEYSVSAKSRFNELINPQPTVPLPE